ncbi:hypothetical protein [Anaerobacillus sp. 1_MG-2023]|uniref:hypothetical protein n=1 Tax=Anaerobacillus sp. 1_MG-2023 TaxID=3062655 RepID=UPI0026E1FD87|nr:hypothetical protein [Anaerobacillus sp. 1_MG-2023]MDO6657860.1 hypothetical protein [Anaerobacillus sp. 1_MG-2023]
MDFIDYLQMRHTIKKGEKQIKERSAKQYQNRLTNLQKKNIYNGETQIREDMHEKIQNHYKDTRNQYPRTIQYYIEYLQFDSTNKLSN